MNIYLISKGFPKEEIYGITSQIRRASTSISTNIAEGFGRNIDLQILSFLNIALGSAQEVEYLLILVKDLNYISLTDYDVLTNQIQKIKAMLVSLSNRINQNSLKSE